MKPRPPRSEKEKIKNNATAKIYFQTKRGYLVRKYAAMKARVTGKTFQYTGGAAQYIGLELLPRSVFFEWSNSNPAFHRLFEEWKASDKERRLQPSIDRIDPKRGYVLENMQWITQSDNSARAAKFWPTRNRHSKYRGVRFFGNKAKGLYKKKKPGRYWGAYSNRGKRYLGVFFTEEEAARAVDKASKESGAKEPFLNFPD